MAKKWHVFFHFSNKRSIQQKYNSIFKSIYGLLHPVKHLTTNMPDEASA